MTSCSSIAIGSIAASQNIESGRFIKQEKQVILHCCLGSKGVWRKASNSSVCIQSQLHAMIGWKATQKAELRREEACAVCAVKDWLENRYEVYLFAEATSTTTWKKHFYGHENENPEDDDDEENLSRSVVKDLARGNLLIEDSGAFCFGPTEKFQAILNVQRYVAQWPLVPLEELHASAIQHPDDLNMRWLLHTRRIKCILPRDVPQLDDEDALPPSAGIGDRDASVSCCKLCVASSCQEQPRMPPLALANSFFRGRHHPLFKEATLASRMLASSARLIMRQLFLGRGAQDEVHKGMTGNTMFIAQPSPSYEQVLPNMSMLTEGMVILFCNSIDDVTRAQMLVVNREQYRGMVQHRQKVCPVFANTRIAEDVIDELPESAVPKLWYKARKKCRRPVPFARRCMALPIAFRCSNEMTSKFSTSTVRAMSKKMQV